jgi:hypothetical protein
MLVTKVHKVHKALLVLPVQ